uniref:Uncharacterized protein n=2 Tax=Populus TaxID=3689 RepID=U5GX42_POPTR|nr:hypothetical protein [Populus tomentosa]
MTHMNDSIFPEPSKFDPTWLSYLTALFRSEQGLGFVQEWLCKDNGISRDPTLSPSKGLPVQIMPKT